MAKGHTLTNNESMNTQQPQKKKVISILVPAYGTVPSAWVQSFMDFMTHNMHKYVLEFSSVSTQPTSKARNMLVESAFNTNSDYVLWIDSDNDVHPGVLDKLLSVMESEKADLVSALYFQRDAPHYAVLRQYRHGGYYNIATVPFGGIIKIDACGLGCCLVKKEVFKKLSKPYFKFSDEKHGYKDIQISEDIYFCRKVQEAGFKMVCDLDTVVGHIGGTVRLPEYFAYEELRGSSEKERLEYVKDACAYLDESAEEVEHKMMVGNKWVREEWLLKDPETDEQIKQFYKDTKTYIYDLGNWHFTGRRNFDVDLLNQIVAMKPKNVLDFGCGVGQNAYMIAKKGIDITIADLDSKSLEFAVSRFERNKVPYSVWYTDIDEEIPFSTYDVILCFDVLEHLTIKQMTEAVDKLVALKHKDTKVWIGYTPGNSAEAPMHFNSSAEGVAQIKRLLNEYNNKKG